MNNKSILKALALGVAVTAAALTTAGAQITTTNTIYSTTNDFGQFGNNTGVVSTSYFSVANTQNGIGNNSAPGATGTAGSLVATLSSGQWYNTGFGPNITGPTQAAFSALSAGSALPWSAASSYGPGTLAAGSGTMTFDLYTGNLGAYWSKNFGFWLSAGGTFMATSSSTFTGADGNTWTQYVIPYTITAAQTGLSYFNWGLAQNVGGPAGTGGETVYVDNIQIATTAVPEPSTIALLVMGGLGLVIMIRRRRVEA